MPLDIRRNPLRLGDGERAEDAVGIADGDVASRVLREAPGRAVAGGLAARDVAHPQDSP